MQYVLLMRSRALPTWMSIICVVSILAYGASTLGSISLQPQRNVFLLIGAGQVAFGPSDPQFAVQWKVLRYLGDEDPMRPRVRLGSDFRTSGPWRLISLPLWPLPLCAIVLCVFRVIRMVFTSGMCAACGYDMSGIPIVDGKLRCPECGHTYATPEQSLRSTG